MIDYERVVRGLEACVDERADCETEGACPYNGEAERNCARSLLRDALALIQEQKAHIDELHEGIEALRDALRSETDAAKK